MTRPAVIACCVILLASSPAARLAHADSGGSAPDVPRARELYEQGRRMFDVKLYAEALERFRAAYQAAPLPAFLYNIALCEDRLGHPDDALDSLQQFFARVDPATDVREVRAFQKELEARRARAGQQPIAPSSTPSQKPVYKRWWPWTVLAGGVVVGVGLGVGLGLGLRDSFSPTLDRVDLR
jgi:tetratricopeptide (TPR) repeat protein